MEVERINRKRKNSENNSARSDFPIYTFHVTSTKPIQFGDVDSISWHPVNNLQYGRVNMKTGDGTKESLLQLSHRIENIALKLAEDDIHYPTDYDFSYEVEQDAAILNVLNNDCLREVFKYFDVADLCNTANVCVRFNQQAKNAFALKFTSININYLLSEEPIISGSLLHNFGPLMESLSMFIAMPDVLDSAGQLCTSLNRLNIEQVEIKSMKKLCPFFKKLKSLSFKNCSYIDNIKEIISRDMQLKYLCIENWFSYDDDDSECIENFQLRSSELFRLIGENMPCLLHLRVKLKYIENLDSFQRDIQYLGNLSSLEVLTLNCLELTVSPLMAALAVNQIQLKKLELVDGEIDDAGVHSICEIKSLQDIKFDDFAGCKREHIIKLAKELQELRSFEIRCRIFVNNLTININFLREIVNYANNLSNFDLLFANSASFNSYDYKTLLEIVEAREKKIGISISCLIHDVSFEDFNMETHFESGEKFAIRVEYADDILIF
ncbi:uncharacterized protein LOC116336653 isoform X2 [Contarinia nasturtii]|uniref:uncharacterized protein LOC116336653 isoform X2 n=1 Tax=Contarinia nasturtii TaxID=265458 RepID=UPI0012D3ED55|nr:uncharacterized protein LOC116336653 isoform X2 [Contarinia nasturtii]